MVMFVWSMIILYTVAVIMIIVNWDKWIETRYDKWCFDRVMSIWCRFFIGIHLLIVALFVFLMICSL